MMKEKIILEVQNNNKEEIYLYNDKQQLLLVKDVETSDITMRTEYNELDKISKIILGNISREFIYNEQGDLIESIYTKDREVEDVYTVKRVYEEGKLIESIDEDFVLSYGAKGGKEVSVLSNGNTPRSVYTEVIKDENGNSITATVNTDNMLAFIDYIYVDGRLVKNEVQTQFKDLGEFKTTIEYTDNTVNSRVINLRDNTLDRYYSSTSNNGRIISKNYKSNYKLMEYSLDEDKLTSTLVTKGLNDNNVITIDTTIYDKNYNVLSSISKFSDPEVNYEGRCIVNSKYPDTFKEVNPFRDMKNILDIFDNYKLHNEYDYTKILGFKDTMYI